MWKQGAGLEAEQKAKLGRRKAVIQEINSALLKARDMQWLVPPELANSIDEAVNADPPPGKQPRSASKGTLEAAYGLYQVSCLLDQPLARTHLQGLHLEACTLLPRLALDAPSSRACIKCPTPPRQEHVEELERNNVPLRSEWVPSEAKPIDWGNGPIDQLFKKHGDGPSGFFAQAPEDMPLKPKHELAMGR